MEERETPIPVLVVMCRVGLKDILDAILYRPVADKERTTVVKEMGNARSCEVDVGSGGMHIQGTCCY
jgi:hypothetical protein